MKYDIESLFDNAKTIYQDDHSLVQTTDNGIMMTVVDENIIYSIYIVTIEGTAELNIMRAVNSTVVDGVVVDVTGLDMERLFSCINNTKKWSDEFIFEIIEELAGADVLSPTFVMEVFANACK